MISTALIVITCYKSSHCIEDCIKALKAQTRQDFQVIIVDNDAGDSSQLSKLDLPDNMKVFKTHENIGFAGASNSGLFEASKTCDFEWVITLNPDAFPQVDWFEVLMQAGQRAPEYAMLSSTLLREDNPDILDGAGDVYSIYGIAWRGGQGHPIQALEAKAQYHDNVTGFAVLGPCGAAAAYRADIFTACGGFDRSLFCYLEDIDLALRLQLLGHKCLHCIEAKVLHRGGASSDLSDNESMSFQYYYSYKNQLRLMIKNIPAAILIVMLPLYSMGLLWILFRTRGERQSRIKLKGLRDGLRSLSSIYKARRRIQARRKISTLQVLRLLAYSPKKLKYRAL